jgi:hypothetical protein
MYKGGGMKPNICTICHFQKKKTPGFKRVQFLVKNKDQLENNKMVAAGMAGDYSGSMNFCLSHYFIAAQFSHLTWEEASPLIRAEIDSGRTGLRSLFGYLRSLFRPKKNIK